MKITFLGTNGWYDTDTGNTVCTLVETNKYNLVLDAGNGIYKLDQYIGKNKPVIIFLSHIHIDHIEGLHILAKFKKLAKIDIYYPKDYIQRLRLFLDSPFTSPFNSLPAKILHGLTEGQYDTPFKFVTKRLAHGDLALGYRFEVDNKILTYCTDTGICKNDELLAKNSTMLIHECTYIDRYISNWGHSSPEEVATLAKSAGVKKLALIHFAADKYLTLHQRDKAESSARKIFANSCSAKDEMTILL